MSAPTIIGWAADAVDAVAEATMAPSFIRVGIVVRKRLEGWGPPPSLSGRAVVVTGATSGIGMATALGLSRLGASVHIVGRDAVRAEEARSQVAAGGGGPVEVDLADLSEPAAVEALGRRLAHRYRELAALVHCAGALSRSYSANSGGTEMTVATQVIGPHVLTAALAPSLGRAGGRIVIVSSGGMYSQRFDLGHLEMGPDGYDGAVAYARSKRAQVLLAEAWAARFGAGGVPSYSMHPGWVDTPGLRAGLPRFYKLWRPLLRTPEEGADTAVWLAAGGAAREGGAGGPGFYHDRRRRPTQRFPVTHPSRPGDPAALVEWCTERTGVTLPLLRARVA